MELSDVKNLINNSIAEILSFRQTHPPKIYVSLTEYISHAKSTAQVPKRHKKSGRQEFHIIFTAKRRHLKLQSGRGTALAKPITQSQVSMARCLGVWLEPLHRNAESSVSLHTRYSYFCIRPQWSAHCSDTAKKPKARLLVLST